MKIKLIFFLLFAMYLNAQQISEKFIPLPFGSVKPTGWLQAQMQKDIDGLDRKSTRLNSSHT